MKQQRHVTSRDQGRSSSLGGLEGATHGMDSSKDAYRCYEQGRGGSVSAPAFSVRWLQRERQASGL